MLNYSTNIALINTQTNKVENVIWGMIEDIEIFKQNGFLPVPYGNLQVGIGDSYDGKNFYHKDGTKALSMAEELAEAKKALKTLGVQV